jgi:hypothetical protein
MIKTFEEFVNENYNYKQDWTREEREQFRSFLTDGCGFARSDWRRMAEFIAISGYTFEEIMKIFDRLNVSKYPTQQMLNGLIELFDGGNSIENKWAALLDIFKEYNEDVYKRYESVRDAHLPVVVSSEGKLLTGEVWCVDDWGEYFESDEDVYSKIEDDDAGDFSDYGDFERYLENEVDNLNMYKVDLDEASGWVEK